MTKYKKVKKNVLIWWIDDEHADAKSDRSRLAGLLKENGINVKPLHPIEAENKLAEHAGKTPQLFLVDYRLNDKKDCDGNLYRFTATALAGTIRASFPEHPIYLISNYLTEEHTREGSEYFDRLLTHGQLSKQIGKDILLYDAQDYRKIQIVKDRRSMKPMLKLADVPHIVREEFISALPKELHGGLGEPSIHGKSGQKLTYRHAGVIVLARWINQILLQNPGILYDDLYAATYLGMKEEYFVGSFCKARSRVKLLSAQYSGIFCSTNPRHWWKLALSEFLFDSPRARALAISRPWEVAPNILNVPNNKRPKCIVCNDSFPETVGYDRDNRDRRAPVHWRCSEVDPEKPTLPYFEPIRLLKE